MSLTCPNCQMQFDTQAELSKHQAKFCVNSNYHDLDKLENRFNVLQNEMTAGQPKANLNEIKAFVAGQEAPPAYRANEVLGEGRFLNTLASQQHKQQIGSLGAPESASPVKESLLSQAERLKNERAIQRQLKSDDEKDVLSLLQELEQKKERELRAAIEKEEIERAIANSASAAGGNLGFIQQEKAKELQRLAQEREAVRIREQGFLDEISKMETSIMKQEQFFKQQKESIGVEDPKQRTEKLKRVREQELELAQQRAAQVASVKVERERLERERQRIMQELEQNKASGPSSGSPSKRVGGFRENTMGKRVGSAAGIFDKPPSGYGARGQGLEPSLKDKLVSDQVRLNNLKNEAQNIQNQKMTDVDEIDVLEREMRNNPGPNFEEGLQKLHQDFQQKSPNRNKNLENLQKRLEMEGGQAALPGNFRTPKPPLPSKQFKIQPMDPPQVKTNNNVDNNLLGKLDDLEELLLGGNKASGTQMTSQGINHTLQTQNQPQQAANRVMMGQMPPQPIGPSSGFPPPTQIPNAFTQLGNQQTTPGMGFGQPPFPQIDVFPYNQPFQDPAMAQLAEMLNKQETENKQLRLVMENFAKNTSPYDELEQQMRAHDNQIKDIANGKMVQGMPDQAPEMFTGGGEENHNAIFPDEFAFRQNDQRADDLEVEERALMNLAAQEYDSLRVIQRLPKDSELYEYKLKQYKELSAMRTEVEKVLQEQRLEKIRRDFEKQKLDEDRALRHAQWMEQQKRSIVDGKVTTQPQFQQMPQYNQPQQQQNLQQNQKIQQDFFDQGPKQLNEYQTDFQIQQQPDLNANQAQVPMAINQDALDQDPTDGYMVMLDAMYGEPRQVGALKCVVRAFIGKKTIGEPAGLGPVGAEPDHTSPGTSLNKMVFNKKWLIPKEALQLGSAKILLEFQAPDAGQTSGFSPAGWTFFDLKHLQVPNNFAIGRWLLPIFTGATTPDAYTSELGANTPPRDNAPGIFFTIKMGQPGDEIFSSIADFNTQLSEYKVPDYHRQTFEDSLKKSKEVKQVRNIPTGAQFDQNYKNSGLKVIVHWVSTKQDGFQQIAMRHTIFIEKGKEKAKDINKNYMEYVGGMIYKERTLSGPKALISINQRGEPVISPASGPSAQGQFVQNQYVTTINYTHEYQKDFYNRYWATNRTKPFWLQLEVFGVANDKFSPLGWIPWQFLNEDDGKLLRGYHVLPLKQGQVTYDTSKQQDSGDFIGITILDLEDPVNFQSFQPTPPPQQPAVNDIGGPVGPQQAAPVNAAQKPQNPVAQQALPNEQDQISEQYKEYDKKKWEHNNISSLDEKIDIFLDGSRFMPDNCYVTRVQLRVINGDEKDLTDPITQMANIEKSTLRNQHYGMKLQLRPKTKQKWSSVSTVLITIDTIDQSTEESVYVGTAAIPLYVQPNKKGGHGSIVFNEKTKGVVLHEGNFQIPLYHGNPQFGTKIAGVPFTASMVVLKERVPTASILLRIRQAKLNDAGQVIDEPFGTTEEQALASQLREPVPNYLEGNYCTNFILFSDSEKEALKMRRRRVNPPLKVLADKLIAQLGKSPDLVDATERASDLQAMIINGFKRQDKDYPKGKKPLNFIDLNYHSQYEPRLGFRATVEAVHDVEYPKGIKAGYFAVLASVAPSLSYYDPNRKSKGVKDGFTFTIPELVSNLSTNLSFRFDEGESVLRGFVPQKPGMSILFDVKMYDPAKSVFQDFGFAVSEVLGTLDVDNDATSMEYYVKSGVFSMQLYKGSPPQELVEQLKVTEKPLRVIEDMVQQGKAIPFEKTSLIVKIVDSQRELHFGKTIDQETPSTRYLPDKKKQLMEYKLLTGGLFGGPKPIKQFLPKQYQSPDKYKEFQKLLRNKFKEFMKLGSAASQAAPVPTDPNQAVAADPSANPAPANDPAQAQQP